MIKATYEDDCEKLRSINQDLTFDYADKFFADAHLKSGHINKKTLCMICADSLYQSDLVDFGSKHSYYKDSRF